MSAVGASTPTPAVPGPVPGRTVPAGQVPTAGADEAFRRIVDALLDTAAPPAAPSPEGVVVAGARGDADGVLDDPGPRAQEPAEGEVGPGDVLVLLDPAALSLPTAAVPRPPVPPDPEAGGAGPAPGSPPVVGVVGVVGVESPDVSTPATAPSTPAPADARPVVLLSLVPDAPPAPPAGTVAAPRPSPTATGTTAEGDPRLPIRIGPTDTTGATDLTGPTGPTGPTGAPGPAATSYGGEAVASAPVRAAADAAADGAATAAPASSPVTAGPAAAVALPPAAPASVPEPAVGAAQHVVDEVVRLVETNGARASRHLVIRLDPGTLGEVQVRLQVRAGVVRVHLTVTDAGVGDALSHDVGRLQSLLGTRADDVVVVVQDLVRPARDPGSAPDPTGTTAGAGGASPETSGGHGSGHRPDHDPTEHGRPTRTSDVTRATDGTQPRVPGPTAADPRTPSPHRLDVSA